MKEKTDDVVLSIEKEGAKLFVQRVVVIVLVIVGWLLVIKVAANCIRDLFI